MFNYQRYLRETKETQDLEEAQPFSGADKRVYTKLYQKDIAAGKAPNLQSATPGKSLDDIKAAAREKFLASKAAKNTSGTPSTDSGLPMSKLDDKPFPGLGPSKDKQSMLDKALGSVGKCKKCGEKLGPKDVYCGECGTPTDKSPTAPTSSPLSAAPAKDIKPESVRGNTISEIIKSAGGVNPGPVISAVRNALQKADLDLKDTSFLN